MTIIWQVIMTFSRLLSLSSDIDTSGENLADNTVFISATEGKGLAKLRHRIENAVLESTGRQIKKLRIPMNGPHLGRV
jgi:50S ribosomal subunit-associated GTPase HflX